MFAKNPCLHFLIPLLFAGSLAFSQHKEKPINKISEKELQEGVLLDVRTPEEYSQGHLKHAINLDWNSPGFFSQTENLPKDKTLYLYCQKGARSARAAAALDSLGFTVIDLLGGYQAYRGREQGFRD